MLVGNSLFYSMYTVVPIFVLIVFLIVLVTIIVRFIKGVGTWSHNNAQPQLTVMAKAVAKRTRVTSSGNAGDMDMHHHHTHSSYFITFEVESGDRLEFNVSDRDYAMVVENDIGRLSFQGTRFIGFTRQRS